MMIYVPDDLPYSACYVLQSNYVLRAYESVPRQNSTIDYIDIALDNHYLYRDGQTTFSQYSTIPTCIDSSRITHSWSYRTDFSDIMIIIMILVVIGYFILSRPIKWLFRGWF